MPKNLTNAIANPEVLNRLWCVIDDNKDADPRVSESARVLESGTTKVAQKFGEEALECVLEAAVHNRDGVVGKSADVLYHLLLLWVEAGVRPHEIWLELAKREHAGDQASLQNGSMNRLFKSVQFNAPKVA
jgi:phosphoribosyl-ATP pyrophosphohydrolase